MQIKRKLSFYLLLGLLILSSIGATSRHKFYVSLTEIRCISEKGLIQISMRIFPDDLDLAVEKISGLNPQFATKLEAEDADKWLEIYLKSTFKIWINDTEIQYKYLGKESEGDAIWCYMEAPLLVQPEKIDIESTLLTSVFEDQKNIIQVYKGTFNKGMLLDRNNTFGVLYFK